MLTDTDRARLDFEAQTWKYAAAKDAAILRTFGETSTAYYAQLGRLLDDPDALAYAPATVRRLVRLRDRRRAVRAAGRCVDISTPDPFQAV